LALCSGIFFWSCSWTEVILPRLTPFAGSSWFLARFGWEQTSLAGRLWLRRGRNPSGRGLWQFPLEVSWSGRWCWLEHSY
jgi:hypothetical protein